jgi:hypothetical protein
VIPKIKVCPFAIVANSDLTDGIFSVEGGSECNVRRLEAPLYVAKDLPISRYGLAKAPFHS